MLAVAGTDGGTSVSGPRPDPPLALQTKRSHPRVQGGRKMKSRPYKASASAAAIAFACGMSGTALANDDVLALTANPGNNLMPSITYNGWNYSTLDQITLANVTDLQIAWTWQVGIQ